MKKYLIIVSVLVCGSAFAFTNGIVDWPFSAPVIADAGNVSVPAQGNIIFDFTSSTAGEFKGYDGNSWVSLGTDSTVSTTEATEDVFVRAFGANSGSDCDHDSNSAGVTSASLQATGECRLNFTTSFTSAPVCTCTVESTAANRAYCIVEEALTNRVDVITYSDSGTAVNRATHIICIGEK